MSESEIGNNELISSLLAERIAETPSVLVPEVEADLPEEQEAKAEEVKVEAPKERDYSEYEEEPAPLQVREEAIEQEEVVLSEEEQAEESERKIRRRAMTAKWGVRLYDKLQGLISLSTYDRLNTPKVLFARRNELMQQVYAGKLSEKEREELKSLNEAYEAFVKRRGTYAEGIHMSEEMRSDVQELCEDLLAVSKREVNPVYILALLLLIPVMSNMVTAFSHKLQYNTDF